MKKILAIILALIMSVGLFAACDNGTPDNSDNTNTNNSNTDNGGNSGNTGNTGGDEGDTGDETPAPCNVTVTCGTGGTYALSPAAPYHVGDNVTLTLTPYSGYAAGEVKVNDVATAVTNNACTFTLAGDTTVEVSFDTIPQHTVTVNCGVGGSCNLSPNRSSYYEGTEVTLTVTVLENFILTEVLLNNEPVELDEDNSYTFTVEEATVIDVSFEDTRYKTVKVNCGVGGDYSLSPEGPYLTGTSVTLTVTPEEGYRVGKVLVNGAEVTLVESKYTFPLDTHTTVEISFVEMGSVFPAELSGQWNPFVESGVVGESLTLGRDSVTFAGKECIVKEGDSLTFTYTDDEGDSTVYTASYRLLREGKYLFTLSYTDKSDSSTVTVYYLKDGVDYFTYSFPAAFVGQWELRDGSTGAITITEDSFTMGTSVAIVMNYDEASSRITMLSVGGEEFTLSTHGSQLAYTTVVDGKEKVVYYSRVIGMDPVLIPQYAGTYTSKDGKNILVVNEDGSAKYSTDSGTSYYDAVFRPSDKFGTMPNCFTIEYTPSGATKAVEESIDFLTDAGLGMRVWIRKGQSDDGVELYASDYKLPTLKVKVTVVVEGGSYTITPELSGDETGYKAGTTVTITITADEGYIIDSYETRNALGSWVKYRVSLNTPTTTYTITVNIDEKKIENYHDYDSTYEIRVTFKEATD